MSTFSDANARTIEAYDEDFASYIAHTTSEISGDHRQWLDDLLSEVDLSARILEIGAGFGRDASYIISKGYDIDATDASQSAVNELRRRNLPARKFNVLSDKIDQPYDFIFAAAVFTHFTENDLRLALRNLKPHINPGGMLSFTTKYGNSERWRMHKMKGSRYFSYWNENSISRILLEEGYLAIETERILEDVWLMVKCRVEHGS